MAAALALLFFGSLAFNAATDDSRYPGPLDLIRRFPWLVLLVLVPVAIYGMWPRERDGQDSERSGPDLLVPVSTFRLPPRNPHFVGRQDVFDEVDRRFRLPGSALAVVHGMAGLGKTQTAIEYAYRHLDEYDFVGFLDSERPDLLKPQFVELAAALGIPNVQRDRAVDLTYEALGTKGRWLLIFDNAERPADYRPFLPRGRAAKSGNVIITTRIGGWAALGQVIDLSLFGRADSMALLTSRALRDPSQVDLTQICHLLGDLPIAIEQAAAYMDFYQVTAADYRSMLAAGLEEMLAYDGLLDRPGVVVATLWDISLSRLAVECPAAVQLLELCSVLAPQPIPLGLFVNHKDLLAGPLAAAAADERLWAATVGAIVGMSLARRDRDGIILHRLEQAAIRHELDPSRRARVVAAAAALLEASTADDVESVPSVWQAWQAILVHLLAIADDAADVAPQATLGTLLQRAARYLRVAGSPSAAGPLAEKAASIHERLHGSSAAVVGTDLRVLARIFRDAGQLERARPYAERALDIHTKALGADSPEVGFDLIVLAQVVRDLGDLVAARGLAERALALHESLLGTGDSQVAFDLTILARVLWDLGQASDALPYASRALDIDEGRYGPRHPQVGTDLTILARIHHDLGHRDCAVADATRALAVMEEAFGPDHPEVATALTIMAQIAAWIGDLGPARSFVERALALHVRTYDADHPYVAFDLVTLCEIDLRQHDVPAALDHARRAVQVHVAACGDQHPFVGYSMTALARALAADGQLDLARSTATKALTILGPTRGPDHPWTKQAAAIIDRLP